MQVRGEERNGLADRLGSIARGERSSGRARPRGAGHHLGVLGKRAGWLEVMRAYIRQKADMTVAQAGNGRDLPWLLCQAGCAITEVIGGVLIMRDLGGADRILSLRSNLADAVADGAVAGEAADVWWALEERDHAGAFFASISGVIVGAARK